MADSVPPPPRRRRLWVYAAPAAAAALVAASAIVVNSGSASGSPSLPPRTAQQLLVGIQRAAGTPFSGQVSERVALGLPTLPGAGSTASLSWQDLLTGNHTARIWADGPSKVRVAVLGQLSEADVVRNGPDLWTYTSETDTVTHDLVHGDTPSTASATNPAAAAAQAIAAITPTTAVSVDRTRTVAGRAAYTLVLTPRTSATTVKRITVAVDSTTSVPLQVQVFGTNSTPAISVGFTRISFDRPSASTFAFTVPKGATVQSPRTQKHRGTRPPAPTTATRPSSRTIGTGWTAVQELTLPGPAGALPGVLGEVTQPVGSTGMRLLHTSLLNAVITRDGRIFVGAVPAQTVESIAAKTPR